MENASKALIMAGGVLISILVISILVFFFNNLKDVQQVEQSSKSEIQATEFNKQYDVYSRDIYGSDILSLANKIADYNKIQSENKGYSKIELIVLVENNIDKDIFPKGTYTSVALKSKIEEIERTFNEVGNISIKSKIGNTSRKVSKLATMRTTEIEALGIDISSCSEQINKYNKYKALQSEIKSKVFRYVNFEYDKNTGRIIKMNYKL